mgnify:FL=1
MTIRSATFEPRYGLKLYVPYAGNPPSVNDAMRSHGVENWSTLKGWKENAVAAARQARAELHLALPLPPSVIRVACPMPTDVRRDPHNYTGTLCKSIIDGLVVTRFWPDDTAEYVLTVDPRLVVVPEVKTPAGRARAYARVQIVPITALRDALAPHPQLGELFDQG